MVQSFIIYSSLFIVMSFFGMMYDRTKDVIKRMDRRKFIFGADIVRYHYSGDEIRCWD